MARTQHTQLTASARQHLVRLFLTPFLLGVAVFWAGCATQAVAPASASGLPTVTSASGRQDVATESDEPDTRKRARLRMELALGYFTEGKTSVALDEIKQSLAHDPNFGDAFNLRGLVYMRLNDLPLAEDSFRRALAINSRDANAAHNYAWLMCQQRRFADAQTLFDQAISNPLYADVGRSHMAKGICLARAGDNAAAEKSLAKAFELDADNPVAGYNLADLLFRRKEFERAQFYLKRINAGPNANAETLWLAVKTERALNSDEGVRDIGMRLTQRFPNSAQANAYQRRAFAE